ncbi:hypothetical protein TNCV_4609091 [Trichonephila clavipes]|nr:hypothetical protein TNCV_4609091 [Trichonephila clavipes]
MSLRNAYLHRPAMRYVRLATKTSHPEVQVLSHSPVPSKRLIENRPVLKRRFLLGVWTVKTVLNPISLESMVLGMAKVVFSILLSGMLLIGRAMESGKRGLGSSSGW